MKRLLPFSIILAMLLYSTCQPSGTDKKQEIEAENTKDGVEAIDDQRAADDTIYYEYTSFQQGVKLFEELNYTPESWQSGIQEIPNMRIAQIPKRWRDSTAQKVEVRLKKQIFFRAIAPLALVINDDIRSDREKLLNFSKSKLSDLSMQDADWLNKLALNYKLISSDQKVTDDKMPELINRVDIIPISLALAQSAEESGWGTSRFANEGNALFGQWSWSADAIKPEQQRSGMGNYGIARFESPLESMRAYMLNLNTHNAYGQLREVRAQLRAQGREPDGHSLASTLTRYSEKGQEYVDNLHKMMRVNRLMQVDSAYLKSNPVIIILPTN